jgi:hypothetical protein
MFVPLRPRSAEYLTEVLKSLAPMFALVFGLLLAVPAAGQIRLHDAAKDDLAKKTRDAYNDFTKEDNTVFDQMIGNTLVLKGATLAQLMELSNQVRRDKVNLIPVSTWKDLRETLVPETQEKFLIAYDAARKILTPAAAMDPGLTDLKSALVKANAQLAEKTKEKNDKKDALDKVEMPKLKSLIESLDALKDSAATSNQPIRNLSDLSAQFTRLKAVWGGITEVKDWLEAAEKATDAPGLQLTILDLGVQHQQLVVERLKLQIEKAKAAEARAALIKTRLELVWGDGSTGSTVTLKSPDGSSRTVALAKQGLFGQLYANLIAGVPASPEHPYPFVTDENEQVLQTIGRLAALAETEVGGKKLDATMQLRDLVDLLSRYVTLVGYQQYLLLADTVEAAADEQLFSIRLSAINTKEREMLVAHGLEGLAAYHAGGLKPEEIANAFRAVQAIAVGVLAGRE